MWKIRKRNYQLWFYQTSNAELSEQRIPQVLLINFSINSCSYNNYGFRGIFWIAKFCKNNFTSFSHFSNLIHFREKILRCAKKFSVFYPPPPLIKPLPNKGLHHFKARETGFTWIWDPNSILKLHSRQSMLCAIRANLSSMKFW